MAYYFAKFRKIGADLIRESTRIYFNDIEPNEEKDKCLGVVIAKNPGSACPNKYGVLHELNLNGDKMLPTIANSFQATFDKSKFNPGNSFVRIFNLFPICNQDLDLAFERYNKIKSFINMENPQVDLFSSKVIFLAWGSENYLDFLRNEWLGVLKPYGSKVFFYTYTCNNRKYHYQLKNDLPILPAKVKHPQGLPKSLIIEGINNFIKK